MILWTFIVALLITYLYICIKTYWNSQKRLNIITYQKLLNISNHLVNCCINVNNDIIYVINHSKTFQNFLIQKALKGELNDTDLKALKLLEKNNFDTIDNAISNLLTKVKTLQNIKPYTRLTKDFSEVVNKNAKEIVKFFLDEKALKACNSVFFLKSYYLDNCADKV